MQFMHVPSIHAANFVMKHERFIQNALKNLTEHTWHDNVMFNYLSKEFSNEFL